MQGIQKISIDLIKPNRFQPRVVFDDDKLIELAQSIKHTGLIQPIVLRKNEDYFEIVAGERRYRASILAGLVEIDAIVVDVSLSELSEMALVENVQREDLSAIEEAYAYDLLLKKHNMTQKDLGKKIGKSQSTIANKLRLLNLDNTVKEAIASKRITERHARILLSLGDQQQLNVLDKILSRDLTVTETEKLVKRLYFSEEKKKPITRGFSRNHQLAINTLNQSVEMISEFGLDVDISQQEFEDEIVMTIRIKK